MSHVIYERLCNKNEVKPVCEPYNLNSWLSFHVEQNKMMLYNKEILYRTEISKVFFLIHF